LSDHPSLTDRQREVVGAVVVAGGFKGAAEQLGISASGAYRRVDYALVRCGCGTLLELVYNHHHEIEGVIDPPTEAEAARR
jgi:FixJ family two-component response regulator